MIHCLILLLIKGRFYMSMDVSIKDIKQINSLKKKSQSKNQDG